MSKPRHLSARFWSSILAILLVLQSLGCAKENQEISATTPTPARHVPTSTQSLPASITRESGDLFLLSLVEGDYAHLFAFSPGELPLTRLTDGAWNDLAPALSPDGKQIAFASNRSGYYDLYLLNLASIG
jgi:hypothetical protein